MKVFSELGHLIEEDEKNQLKITSLNSDIMQKIGSYLLEIVLFFKYVLFYSIFLI